MTVERQSCPLGCDAGLDRLAIQGAGASYGVCRVCGLIVDMQRPTHAEIRAQYQNDRSSPSAYYARCEHEDLQTFRRRLRLMGRFVPRPGRLLDVGCSTGTSLVAARALGWQTAGIDPNPVAVQIARERGLDVELGFLGDFKAGDIGGPFDCVVLSEVLEHLPEPRQALEQIRSLLLPGGLLLCSTPNAASRLCRLFQLKSKEHLYLFSIDNLRALVESRGFDICHCQTTSRMRSLAGMEASTTEIGTLLRWFVAVTCRLGLDVPLSRLMARVMRDEILTVARRR